MRRTATRLIAGLSVFILIGWLAGELWTSAIGSSEIELMREVAARRTRTLGDLARIVTWAGSDFVLVPLALISCALLARAGLRVQALAIALTMVGAIVISSTVKALVARPRPPVEHLQAVSSFSFPSGHATQASAFWLSLVLAASAAGASRKLVALLAAPALAITAAVALSRVYLGVHYPGDVVAGLLLGGGWAAFVALWALDPRSDRGDLLSTTDAAGPRPE